MGINISIHVEEGERRLRERGFVSEYFEPIPTALRRRCIRRSVPTPANAEPTSLPAPEEGKAEASAAASTAVPTTSTTTDQPEATSRSGGEPNSSSTAKSMQASTITSATGRSGFGASGGESTISPDTLGDLIPTETTVASSPTATDDSVGGKPGSKGAKSTAQIVAIIGAVIAAILVIILLWWLGTRLWKNWKDKRTLSPTPVMPLPFTNGESPSSDQKEKWASGAGVSKAAGTMGAAAIAGPPDTDVSILLQELPGPELGISFEARQELDTPVIQAGMRSSNGDSFMASSFDAMSVDEMSFAEMRPTSMI